MWSSRVPLDYPDIIPPTPSQANSRNGNTGRMGSVAPNYSRAGTESDHVDNVGHKLSFEEFQANLLEPNSHSRSPSFQQEPDGPEYFETPEDPWGLFRRYHIFPTNPELDVEDNGEREMFSTPTFPPSRNNTPHRNTFSGADNDEDDESSSSSPIPPSPPHDIPQDELPPHYPFTNQSIADLINWHYTQPDRSIESLKALGDKFTKHPVSEKDFIGFNPKRELKNLDRYMKFTKTIPDLNGLNTIFESKDGWIDGEVHIPVPPPPRSRFRNKSEADAPKFTVKNVLHRSLLNVVVAAFQQPHAASFELKPFEQWWRPGPGEEPVRVSWETYMGSDALKMESEIARLPSDPDGLESVVGLIHLWSDSTRPTNFGSHTMWPIYLALGNQTKYERGSPSMGAMHHVAYIPTVSFNMHLLCFVPAHHGAISFPTISPTFILNYSAKLLLPKLLLTASVS